MEGYHVDERRGADVQYCSLLYGGNGGCVMAGDLATALGIGALWKQQRYLASS